jgi:preprotein translocase subunit YajC
MTASTRSSVSRSRLVAIGVAVSTAGVLAAVGPAAAAAVGSGAAVAAARSAGVVGTVLSVDASARTFVIRVASGAHLRVDVTTTTVYKVGGGASATFAALRPGDSVAVIGTGTGSSRSETAAIVVIGKASPGSAGSGFSGAFGGGFPGGFGRGTFGTVVSVDASGHSFELKLAKGAEVKVVVTSSTTYRDRTDSSASFAQVKKGESVAVLGTTSKGVETAKTVVIGLPGGIGGAVPQPSGS